MTKPDKFEVPQVTAFKETCIKALQVCIHAAKGKASPPDSEECNRRMKRIEYIESCIKKIDLQDKIEDIHKVLKNLDIFNEAKFAGYSKTLSIILHGEEGLMDRMMNTQGKKIPYGIGTNLLEEASQRNQNMGKGALDTKRAGKNEKIIFYYPQSPNNESDVTTRHITPGHNNTDD